MFLCTSKPGLYYCLPPAYGAGGLKKAVIKDVYVLRAFRPLLGQPMRVRDEMNKSSF